MGAWLHLPASAAPAALARARAWQSGHSVASRTIGALCERSALAQAQALELALVSALAPEVGPGLELALELALAQARSQLPGRLVSSPAAAAACERSVHALRAGQGVAW